MARRQLAATAVVAVLAAASPTAAAQAPRIHALVGARIVVAPGKTIGSGTVVLRDGLIAAVGADTATPADARVWEAKGLTLYPGLIDAYTVRSVPEVRDDKAQAGHPNKLVRADRDATAFAADEGAFKKLREAGFTIAVVAPKDGLFRGRSDLLTLGSTDLARALLRRGVAQNVTIQPNKGDDDPYPDSLMGAVALFRQSMLDAGWQNAALAAFARNARQPRPALSPALAALGPAAAGQEVMVFETSNVLDTLRDAALVKELRLKAWLVGNGHEYERIADVRATGLAHILPLAFPKEPKPGAKGDPNIELDDLRHWDRAADNPKAMIGTGLEVAFSSFGLDDPGKLHENLEKAIVRGLTADQALAALTVAPAKLLGLSDRAGTIEAGKMANLVEVEGDLFVDKPKIRAVWIEGERFEVKVSKPAKIDPAGTWTLTVKTPDGQSIPATLEVAGKSGSWTGSIAALEKKVDLQSVEVSGKKLIVEFEGSPFGESGTVKFELEIDGDNASGSGEMESGTLEVTGSRTPKRGTEVGR
jgi:imidazolonepropionase-like amidohydrolase